MKNYIIGFISGLVLMAFIVVRYIWPPEFNLLFTPLFWSSAFLFASCTLIVGYLFFTKGGSSRGSRFFFGLLLIISAAAMFSGFEEISSNVTFWKPHFSATYSNFLRGLILSLLYAKSLISFGFAALGSNIAANAIDER